MIEVYILIQYYKWKAQLLHLDFITDWTHHVSKICNRTLCHSLVGKFRVVNVWVL